MPSQIFDCQNTRSQNAVTSYRVGLVLSDHYTIDANDIKQPAEVEDDTWRLRDSVKFQDALHQSFAAQLVKTEVSIKVKLEPESPIKRRRKRASKDRVKHADFITSRPNVTIVNVEPLTEPLASLYDTTSGVNAKMASVVRKNTLSSIIRAKKEADQKLAARERLMHSLQTELEIARAKLQELTAKS